MSFPRYPKYKDSGVEWLGQVPEHWEAIRYKNVFAEKFVEAGGSLPLGSISFGRVVFKTDDFFNEATKATYQEVLAGEFLINPINLNYDLKSLRTALSEINTCVSPAYIVLKAKESPHKNFLKHQLHAFDLFHMKTLGAGVRQTITFGDIGDCRTYLPPLPEQTRIAEFLDRETGKIDALVAEQQRLMALLKEKRQAVISQAVTKGLNPNAPMKPSGIEWLGDVPAHWVTPSLNSRYSCELGKMLDESRITGAHLVPYLRNTDVQWDAINYQELHEMDIQESEYPRYTIQTGDLLVCEGGEVGRAAMVRELSGIFGFQKALHRLRPRSNSEHTRFLYYTFVWAAATGVFSAGGTATIAHLTGEQLRRYRFPKPPYNEQTVIAEFLDAEIVKFNTLTAEAQRAIDLLQERRTALISAAVTGQIDVRNAN
jgi:type I restriction enzyme S subunit